MFGSSSSSGGGGSESTSIMGFGAASGSAKAAGGGSKVFGGLANSSTGALGSSSFDAAGGLFGASAGAAAAKASPAPEVPKRPLTAGKKEVKASLEAWDRVLHAQVKHFQTKSRAVVKSDAALSDILTKTDKARFGLQESLRSQSIALQDLSRLSSLQNSFEAYLDKQEKLLGLGSIDDLTEENQADYWTWKATASSNMFKS